MRLTFDSRFIWVTPLFESTTMPIQIRFPLSQCFLHARWFTFCSLCFSLMTDLIPAWWLNVDLSPRLIGIWIHVDSRLILLWFTSLPCALSYISQIHFSFPHFILFLPPTVCVKRQRPPMTPIAYATGMLCVCWKHLTGMCTPWVFSSSYYIK